jgi:hypothetical protein
MVQFLNIIRKKNHMKRLIFSIIILSLFFPLDSQVSKTEVLQGLEKNQAVDQNIINTATIKTATRLFKYKDDLTSVIIVIPQDSVVNVLGSDDTFLHVVFEGNEGYIYSRHAEINKPAETVNPSLVQEPAAREKSPVLGTNPVREQTISRYEYLEKRYGPSMAARLYDGKIWKGINSEMVKDSWGSPKKINRIISGNVVKEEWIYNNTWLYFQNSTLTDWGPVRN